MNHNVENNTNFFNSVGLKPIGFFIVNGYLLISFALYVFIAFILRNKWSINFARYNDIVIFIYYSIIVFIVYKYHINNIKFINYTKLNLRRYILLSCAIVFSIYSLKFIVQLLSGNYLDLKVPQLFAESNLFLFTLHSFFAVTIGPILEELIFRGFMYPPLRKKFSAFISIIISATIFSFWHFGAGVKGYVNLFLIGILLSYLYEKSKSLIPSIVAHSLINFTWVITILYKYYEENAHYIFEKKHFVVGLATIYFILSLIFYLFYKRQTDKSDGVRRTEGVSP